VLMEGGIARRAPDSRRVAGATISDTFRKEKPTGGQSPSSS